MAKLLSTLPVGSKVRFGRHSINGSDAEDIVWLVAANNHVGYPSDTVSLISKDLIDQRALDAKEPSNSDVARQNGGSNRYAQSNIHQWLNKSGTGWFLKASSTDEAPNSDLVTDNTEYSNVEGFMSKFTLDELKLIKPTNIAVTIVQDSDENARTIKTLQSKFFIPSKAEVGFLGDPIVEESSHVDEITGETVITTTQIPNLFDEGVKLPLFENLEYLNSGLTYQAFISGSSTTKPGSTDESFIWGLRTPHADNTSEFYAIDGGLVTSRQANTGHVGIRPLCNLSSDVYVIESIDGVYDILYSDIITNVMEMKTAGIGFNWEVKLAGEHLGVKSQVEILNDDGDVVTKSEEMLGQGLHSANVIPRGEGIYIARVKLWSNSLDITYSNEIRYSIGKVKYELKVPTLKTLQAGAKVVKIPVKCTQDISNMEVHAVNRHNIVFKISNLELTDSAKIKITGTNTKLDKLAYNIR